MRFDGGYRLFDAPGWCSFGTRWRWSSRRAQATNVSAS